MVYTAEAGQRLLQGVTIADLSHVQNDTSEGARPKGRAERLII